MLMRISILENEVHGRGEKPEDDPITLITEAVGIVLEEESNLEILKALKSRRALNAQGRFDPQRNTRNESTPSHGQTCGRPTVLWPDQEHLDDARLHVLRDQKYTNTPAHKRQHVDLDCPNATKAEKDALRKRSASRTVQGEAQRVEGAQGSQGRTSPRVATR